MRPDRLARRVKFFSISLQTKWKNKESPLFLGQTKLLDIQLPLNGK
jgi:hypothetical protein